MKEYIVAKFIVLLATTTTITNFGEPNFANFISSAYSKLLKTAV